MRVEVAYALPTQQWLLEIEVPQGATVFDAAQQAVASGLLGELDLSQHRLGVFGQIEAAPRERVLQAGERVEIYRSLIADPKEIRKARARKAQRASS